MRRRFVTATILGGLVLLLTIAIAVAVVSRPAPSAGPARVATGTAPVRRGAVTQRLQLPGVLGFDGQYSIVHYGQSGIVTSVPVPGSTVRQGGVLYGVALEPVWLLYGDLPAYRDFAPGMRDGPDVRQLERALVALG